MFARLEHDIQPVLFPKEWANELKQILLNIYGDKCLKDEKTFEVYGFSYPTEALLIVSYVDMQKFDSPITLFLSSDLTEKTEASKVMDNMFDSAGVFFDQYFSKEQTEDEIWEDFVLDWDEADFDKHKLFYKITRENVGLTIEANLLLGE